MSPSTGNLVSILNSSPNFTYSGTFTNQHPDAEYPHGAWEYHERLIPQSPAKPLRSRGSTSASAR